MNTSPRQTDVILSLRCPNCGSMLSLLAGRSQLTFHCKGGHAFPMRQLFQAQAQDVNRGLRSVLEIWQEKSAVLQKVVERAVSDGRSELAGSFRREVEQIESKIRTLREHLRCVSSEYGNEASVAG